MSYKKQFFLNKYKLENKFEIKNLIILLNQRLNIFKYVNMNHFYIFIKV